MSDTILPAGTITFCFTDIEGSTHLWERHRQAMPAALARHDALLGRVIASHGGVIFKTVGDGVHAVFVRATDALEAALAAQRELHAADWGDLGALRVRMALHTGTAEPRNGDYIGPSLNRVGGILALAHGGQILLSHSTHNLVADDLPAQTVLLALGEHRLKDLTRPEQIFQLVSQDLASEFPPLLARDPQPAPVPQTSAPLLATKLYIPALRAQIVPRPRLVERLEAGRASKLTLIVAPAGFGKTTLMSAWHAAAPSTLPIAWVALDRADNDPVRFWSYVVAAIDTVHTGLGTSALVQLQSPQPPPIEVILTTLLNTLTTWPTDIALILDDYHLIDAAPIHQALAFLLDHLPPHLHLVIATRANPPIPLSRLRARGELTELRAADLRFTPDEAAVFLTEVMRLPLTASAVATLETRTEGWIAGLQFAALAMRDRTDLAGFIAAFTGSNRFVVDYLAEEVLNHLPHHLQTFLLQTAILDRMCGPLCDALLGVTSDEFQVTSGAPDSLSTAAYSQVLLQELEHANLFMVPLDDTRRWYRYHHLFVDVLRRRLTSGASAISVATLHLRASAWFEEHGFVAEAVQHALAANDGDRAAHLVEQHGDAVWMRGGLATLLGWLTALPDAAFEARPKLALNHAFLLMVLDGFRLSERRLAAAERALHAAPVPDMLLLGQAAGIRAGIALMADYPADVTIAAGQRALELLPASSATWRGLAGNFLGCGYYAQAGNLDAGYQMLLEAEQVGLRAGDAFITSLSATHITILLEIQGQLRDSEQRNQHNLQRASEPFWQGVPLAGYAHFGLSRVLYEHNQLHAARDHLTEAVTQLEAWSLKRPIINTYVLLARVHLALGEPAYAREWMERAVALVQKDDLKQTFSHWAAYQVRMDLAQGDLSAPAQWAREMEPTIKDQLNPAREFEHITLAQVYLAQQRFDDAQHLLARLLPAAQAAKRMARVIAIIVLQALTARAQGKQLEAHTALEAALGLAEPEGYIRTFIDHGAPMAELLAQVAGSQSPAAAYASKLAEAFPSPNTERTSFEAQEIETSRAHLLSQSPSRPASEPLAEPLSARELEILYLIADGLSNQAIAERLVIAVSTVKKHINNLYGKLAVESRTQVLLRARELHLL